MKLDESTFLPLQISSFFKNTCVSDLDPLALAMQACYPLNNAACAPTFAGVKATASMLVGKLAASAPPSPSTKPQNAAGSPPRKRGRVQGECFR